MHLETQSQKKDNMQNEVDRGHPVRSEVKSALRNWVVYSVEALLFVIAALVLAFMIQGHDFFLYRYFAPKYEAARRETFEESKAYNEGMAQDLWRMQVEYTQASLDKRPQLAGIILHRVAGYDTGRLPTDLQSFITELRREILGGGVP
jgi:hypothetical protein